MSDFKRSNPGCCECTGGDCPPGSICFDVNVCGDSPAVGATLTIHKDGAFVETVTLDGSGEYCFTTTDVSVYSYAINRAGYAMAAGTVTSLCGATVTKVVNLLAPFSVCAARIFNCIGPLVGAPVTVTRGGTLVASGFSGSGGFFYFSADVDGNYTVTASSYRYTPLSVSVFVYACTYQLINVPLVPIPGYHCCGDCPPMPTVMHATVDAYSVTLTYSGGRWYGCFTATQEMITYVTTPPLLFYPNVCYTSTSIGSFPVAVTFSCGGLDLHFLAGPEITALFGEFEYYEVGRFLPSASNLYETREPPTYVLSRYLVPGVCAGGSVTAPPTLPYSNTDEKCDSAYMMRAGSIEEECIPYYASGTFAEVSPGHSIFSAFTVSE